MNKEKLGTENIGKLLASLAIPAVVAQIVNLLYNIVDRVYIGHIPGIGAAALTGVGLFTPILMMINAFAMFAGSGGAPKASIFFGAKENEKAEKVIGNCFSFSLIVAVILTVIFYVFAPQLLTLFGASEATLPYALSYARIYVLGTVVVLIVLGMNPFITIQGFAKTSMLTTVVGAVINIILDPVFIFIFDMGVQGAAIATVLSQTVGALWILKFLCGKKTILHLKKEYMKIEKDILMPCLALGSSTFVMISTESLLSMTFTSSLARYGGDIAVGAMTIITSVSQLCTTLLQGIVQGGQTIISYNFGAGNNDRVKKAFVCELIVCAVYSCSFFVLMMFLPNVFASIFTSDVALTSYTANVMRIYMAGIFANGFQISCQNTFVGLSQAKISLFLAVLRKLILLIPLILILPVFMSDKVFAVFLAEPISDILAATVTTITFMTRFNKILAKGPQR